MLAHVAMHSYIDDWVLANENKAKVARATKYVATMTDAFGLIPSHCHRWIVLHSSHT